MNGSELRRLAEEKIYLRAVPDTDHGDSRSLDHELRLHRVELDLQQEELERAQAEVEDARSRYIDLYQLSPVGCLTFDEYGSILEANRTAELMLEQQESTLLGRTLESSLNEEDADCFRLHLRRTFELKCKQRCEVRIARPDGTSFPALLDSIVLERQGVCLTTLFDVSDQRRVEEAMREAVQRFHQLTDHIEDVFFICQRSTGRVDYVSTAVERLLGMPPAAIMDRRTQPTDWVLPADRPRVFRALVAFLRGDPFDLEFRILRPDGVTRFLRVRAFPVPGEDRVSGIATDVTDERMMEEELRHAHKMEAIGALASGIAHDFNNLLMGVAGFATITMRSLDGSHPSYGTAKRIIDIANRGKVLTQQLLDFSRKRPSDPRSIEIDAAVANTKALVETLVGESIHVVVRCDAGRCRVRADAGEIEQMLMNLATNARDSMPRGGTLLITTTEVVVEGREANLHAGRYVSIQVRDTGSGMDEATKRRIFEPFFTTKAPGAGTGLGLSTTFAIVRRMGGDIAVDSAPRAGTTFTIRLPVLPETMEMMLHEVAPTGEGSVLLIEDDPFVRESVADYLKNAGYNALVAADAEDALHLVADHRDRIRLLLTDVVMPHRSGRDLADEIRGMLPGVIVVYMSAHPREELIDRAWIEPDAVLIQKPFDELRLALTLHRVRSA